MNLGVGTVVGRDQGCCQLGNLVQNPGVEPRHLGFPGGNGGQMEGSLSIRRKSIWPGQGAGWAWSPGQPPVHHSLSLTSFVIISSPKAP